MDQSKLVELGFARKPHGIRGEVLFSLYSDHETILEDGHEVTLFPLDGASCLKKSGEKFLIEKISIGNKIIVQLQGVVDRTMLEKILPFSIFFPRDQFPEIEEGEYYLEDLVGLKVLCHSSFKELGLVEGAYDNGAQTILVIVGEDGQKWELPFIDQFFPEIKWDEKAILMVKPVYLE